MKELEGSWIGRFHVVHALAGRVRLKSALLHAPDFDALYFQALVEALPGVESVRINRAACSIAIAYNRQRATWSRVETYLRSVPPEAFHQDSGQLGSPKPSDVAGRAGLLLLAQALPLPLKAGISWALCLDTVTKGVETLVTRGVKVPVLDGLAVGLSLLRGSYFTAGAISTLLALGECLEERSEQRSAELLKSLLRPQARDVWVIRDGVETRIPVERLISGDRAVFGAGEGIAVDGTVVEGEASVNQSSISGESVPVHIRPGDTVISGSVVDEGRLVVEVEHAGAESSVARIGRFIDQSLRSKSPRQSKSSELADKLVPVTLGLSALVWLTTRDTKRTASVLTVDFSCAIKLASPIAARSGIYAAGQAGVLLKGATALDALIDVDTYVFDKTGTLTTGRLVLTDIIALEGLEETDVLAMAAGAEEHYDHPVARAVVREAVARGVPLPPVSRVDFIVAHGVSAFIKDDNILVGSHHFISEDEGVACGHVERWAESLRAQGKSLLYVARNGRLAGIIALLDEPRPEAAAALQSLKDQGIKKIVVLTGDHRDTALALQRRLPQIDEIHFELKPEDKAAIVASLQRNGLTTAFVGDGVNDAPALVNAHVGVCMPGGADIAKEAAQVMLLHEDLSLLALAGAAARRTNRIVRRCLASTIGCNTLTILLALAGLPPAASALLHNASTVAVIGYAGMAASRKLDAKELAS